MTAAELEQLLPDAEQLPDSVRDRVLALGEAAHAAIAELVRREVQAIQDEEESNLGWRANHAVRLAGALQVQEVIHPLLDLLDVDDVCELAIFDDAVFALRDLGPAVINPILARWEQFDDLNAPGEVLGHVGEGDERVFARLAEWFRDEPEPAAMALADLGDARAIPLIRERLAGLHPEVRAGVIQNLVLVELADALERLGAALTPEECQKVAAVRRLAQTKARTGTAAPGRNDPCWCGSGTKYKKCHLDADQKARP